MLVSIGAYDLCNGTVAGGVAVGNLRFAVDRTIDIVIALPTSDAWLSPITFDRLTGVSSITFQVQRTHVDVAAASAFILGLEAALPSTGYVVLSDGATEFTIPNGKIKQHVSSQLGATTTTIYNIIGGRPVSGSGSGP
jgi:hypothetical protein